MSRSARSSAGGMRVPQNGGVTLGGSPTDRGATSVTAESCWVAARVLAKKNQGEPDIQAHTNPVYLLSGGKPVRARAARESLVKQWEEQLAWYRSTDMVFRDDSQRRNFFDRAERTLTELRRAR